MFKKKKYKPLSHVICDTYSSDITEHKTILSKNIRWHIDTEFTHTNNNVLIIGDKTKTDIIRQNLLNDVSNFVIVDPEGELLNSTKSTLEKQGYTIKTINFTNPEASDHYNPFQHFQDGHSPYSLAKSLLSNDVENAENIFFKRAQEALLQAIIFYLANHSPKENQKLSSVIELLHNCSDALIEPNAKSKLDTVYQIIGTVDPDDLGYKEYSNFVKFYTSRTKYEAIQSCLYHLSFLEMPKTKQITDDDTLGFAAFNDTKQALFIITSKEDNSYKPLIDTIYMQLMENLYFQRAISLTDTSSRHVRFFLDANATGKIYSLSERISTLHTYNISCFLIANNQQSIEDIYGIPDGLVALNNFDTVVFLNKIQENLAEYMRIFPTRMKVKRKILQNINEESRCFIFILNQMMFIDQKI